MENLWNMVSLAVLQGVTEFLPVSSSGHLVVAQHFLGVKEPGETVEIALHFGTMLSIIAYYRKELWGIISGFFKREPAALGMVLRIFLSTLPAVVFYFLCKKRIDAAYADARMVGGFLIFTGFILLLLRFVRVQKGALTPWKALLVGVAQAIAIFPGVSRSGMTIASARLMGVDGAKSAEFSFLMCLPLLAGATLLALLGHTGGAAEGCAFSMPVLGIGIAVSAIVGYLCLAWLVKLLKGGAFWVFGLYCLAVGACLSAFL